VKPQRNNYDLLESTYRYNGPLRTADGKLPQGCPWNRHWGLRQGEFHEPPEDRTTYRIDLAISLIELNNGRWIARPIRKDVLFDIDSHQFETREAALRAAVAHVIRRVRWRVRATGDCLPFGYKINPEKAQEIITWAMGLLNLEPLNLYHPPAPDISEAVRGQLELDWHHEPSNSSNPRNRA
jgi:hypothetical protein